MDASQFDSWDKLVAGYGEALKESRGEEKPPFLSAGDRLHVEQLLFRQVQSECFQHDLATLSVGKPVSNKSRFSCLSPEYDDKDQLIRVGGRLRRASVLDVDAKHQIVLDPKHPITRLLTRKADCCLGYSGTDMVLADLCRRFWLLRGRQSIKSVQSHCEGCIRRRGKPLGPKMVDLPPHSTPHRQTCLLIGRGRLRRPLPGLPRSQNGAMLGNNLEVYDHTGRLSRSS